MIRGKYLDLPALEADMRIDGRLDESVWRRAAVVEDLVQVDPFPGAPGSAPTRVRFFRDQRTLFVGVEAIDLEPDLVIARQLKRDANQGGDDRFVLAIDSLGGRRDGYLFGINPLGARTDALVSGQALNQNWDGIWSGAAVRTSTGWTAELAIPFATLAFREGGNEWGLNFERIVARRSETVRWAATTRNQRVHYFASAGRIGGTDGLNVGLGLELRPFVKLGWSQASRTEGVTSSDGGFDLRWRVTPTISAALTYNTDFSETEVDDRLINLTRFSTFFPEKRAFFLEDATIFEFGGISGSPLPFFSRRIGLDARGQPVDLRVGLKSTGRIGPFSFGVMGAQTRDAGGEQALGVVRGRADFLEESSAGFIFTSGNPAGPDEDWLAGMDLSLQTSRWRGDRLVRLNTYMLQSQDTQRDVRAGAYGLGLRYPTDRFSLTTNFTRIDDGFRSPLGYVRQRGIYSATNRLILRWRPQAAVDSVDWGTVFDYVTDLDGKLDHTEYSIFDFTVFSRLRDRAGASWFVYREALDRSLVIGPGVSVPAGIHDTQRLSAWVGTGGARPVQFNLRASWGGFYHGDSFETEASLALLRSARFHLSLDHEYVAARLPTGDFDVHNTGLRASLNFTPDLYVSLVANWDNLSRNLGGNVRFRWTVGPGRDLYLVFNQSVDTTTGWRPIQSGLTSKASWAFRF